MVIVRAERHTTGIDTLSRAKATVGAGQGCGARGVSEVIEAIHAYMWLMAV